MIRDTVSETVPSNKAETYLYAGQRLCWLLYTHRMHNLLCQPVSSLFRCLYGTWPCCCRHLLSRISSLESWTRYNPPIEPIEHGPTLWWKLWADKERSLSEQPVTSARVRRIWAWKSANSCQFLSPRKRTSRACFGVVGIQIRWPFLLSLGMDRQ